MALFLEGERLDILNIGFDKLRALMTQGTDIRLGRPIITDARWKARGRALCAWDDLVPEGADLLDLDGHLVARLERADAGGSARGDHIAREQGH